MAPATRPEADIVAIEPATPARVGRRHRRAAVRAAHEPPQRRRRPGPRLVAPALRVRGQDLVHSIPGRTVDDRLVLARIALALVDRLAEVGAIAQDLVQRALVERPPLAEGARLCGPGLGAAALGVQLPDQQEGRAEVEKAPEDQADQFGLGRVHHQLPVPHVVAETTGCRPSTCPCAGTPRSCRGCARR